MKWRLAQLALFAAVVPIVAQGQSVAQAARASRQASDKAKPAAKVFTNEDFPEHGLSDDDVLPPATPASVPANSRAVSKSSADAQRCKAQITAQKSAIGSLQNQIDRLNATVHYVEANRYYNGAQHNQRQAEKQEQVRRMQGQLEEQNKNLEAMQEACRRAGFGNAIYDP